MTDVAQKTVERTQAEIEAEIASKLAEAEKNTAEAKRAEAEAKKFTHEAREAKARADCEEDTARCSAIDMARIQEVRRRELATDRYHHVYQFTGVVKDNSVSDCIDELSYWHRQCNETSSDPCPMTIVFYSPGGTVFAGMQLFDYISYLRRQGHRITTVCSGWAASMGAVLMQAGDVRIMGPESYLLIHEVSGGAMGSTGDMEDTMELIKKMNKRIAGIFASRSTMTLAAVEKRMNRKDWSLSSDEALKLGLVDEVR